MLEPQVCSSNRHSDRYNLSIVDRIPRSSAPQTGDAAAWAYHVAYARAMLQVALAER